MNGSRQTVEEPRRAGRSVEESKGLGGLERAAGVIDQQRPVTTTRRARLDGSRCPLCQPDPNGTNAIEHLYAQRSVSAIVMEIVDRCLTHRVDTEAVESDQARDRVGPSSLALRRLQKVRQLFPTQSTLAHNPPNSPTCTSPFMIPQPP